MDYALIKAAVAAVIKENGNEEITGNILQQVILAVIDVLGFGYQYKGIATPSTAPGTPDAKVFYIAQAAGTYSNFNDGVSSPVLDGTAIGLFAFDTQWHNTILDVATKSSLAAYLKIADLAAGIGDSETTAMTQKAVTELLDGVATELGKKANKVVDGTSGNLPKLTSNGDLADSDIPATDVATKQELAVATLPGLAEAVIDTDGAGTEQEFTFRKSGGDGGAYYRKIKGKTLAWNQIVPIPSAQGVQKVGSSSVYTDFGLFPIISGHKYFVELSSTAPDFTFIGWIDNNDYSRRQSYSLGAGSSAIITSDIDIENAAVWGTSAEVGTCDVEINIVDLTLAGIADEISTPADFEALYPDIYPYTPGTLISNDAEAVETTGVNQWDEEWEKGIINSQTGEDSYSNTNSRSKNYIPVIEGQTYYFKAPYSLYTRLYNKNKEYLGQGDTVANNEYLIPAGVAFIRFVTDYAYISIGDICINLSNAAINGQYFPYWERTLQLGITTRKDTDGNVPFADGMKGAGTAADWADKVGGEKRIKRINLGDLEWGDYVYTTNEGHKYRAAAITDMAVRGYGEWNAIAGSGFSVGFGSDFLDTADKTIARLHQSNLIVMRYDAFIDDLNAFKTAINGAMLDYELATPVPFTWAEPLNLGVKVDENGTERAVQPAGATEPSAPFVADTTYTMSIARMVQKLASI